MDIQLYALLNRSVLYNMKVSRFILYRIPVFTLSNLKYHIRTTEFSFLNKKALVFF